MPHFAEPADGKRPRKADCADSFYGTTFYLITELGSLISLKYDFGKQMVVKIGTTEFIKRIACYKIKQIQIT
jgi:hypothetical protein